MTTYDPYRLNVKQDIEIWELLHTKPHIGGSHARPFLNLHKNEEVLQYRNAIPMPDVLSAYEAELSNLGYEDGPISEGYESLMDAHVAKDYEHRERWVTLVRPKASILRMRHV
ncbi:uncharacterized protein BO95DRAFT_461329 [Aspergillus brunneoviolaceus CBS 621.78]|uniref:Uncharacterized protein n=1 Tax=Aspergillus brunneoviolaceus CBS 621.78 TaxID=1450534 RepID=A0ACD1GG78_9EURO|nr:hypothetical protein BO95DRAFT_461329 [Aspergillus brunneoviolaceus CBS 621.78]RAH48248.1 hypothetical protein BO95DRAFT_461329 [Aspergillus brunneoviolaceus CBS 621.78]